LDRHRSTVSQPAKIKHFVSLTRPDGFATLVKTFLSLQVASGIERRSMTLSLSSIDSQTVARVLSEIAECASETLELQDVFGRIATSVRHVIPLDHMGVIRVQDGGVVRHASTFGVWAEWKDGKMDSGRAGADCQNMSPCSLVMWSERIRPRAGAIPRVGDAQTELDPGFEGDRHILEDGVRSMLWEPFRTGDAFVGGVWVSARQPNAFTDDHQDVLRPIAALLGTAVEHWRMWDAERRRRQRLDQLEGLSATLAESLDIRDVFPRVSEAAKKVLPHHALVLTKLEPSRRTIRLLAIAGEHDGPRLPEVLSISDAELERRVLDFELLRDIQVELNPPTTEREKLMVQSGMRSWLRVPVWLAGEARGSIGFFHREAGRYEESDVEVATRLADRVALMLSHQKLSEEARNAAAAQERAERLEATVQTLARELESRGRIVGLSQSWRDVMVQVGRVAPVETTVLITGESGTGKEVVSSLIHQGSPRAGKPFLAINCAALPEQLLESELFGHERGAFTGAAATKIGRIEQAAGGTLFLDELAEMSPTVQAKFLRLLEQREFMRLGGTRTLKADVRVIAATNRDLSAAIAKGAFREDLFYRLNVFQIHIPPLRQRPQDILPLAETFMEDLGRTMGRPAAGISRDAREWLLSYSWPGNVRELRNAIERAILLCDGGLITHDHLPAPLVIRDAPMPKVVNGMPVTDAIPATGDLGAMERGMVEKALGDAKGNKTRAARLLGITRAQLYSRLDKHGLR
jgi:transcriptional regulator with GAF, ATPase, and Fis domain